MSDTPVTHRRKRLKMLPWYYVTRAIGATILLFGVFGDHSTDRGTIILTGAGMLGLDKVARNEPPPKGE